ncbi:hypothetical protein LCGC14_1446640 [marine sediment metagenome]|uniref:Uncharacterized protein n=1 Tax=marine sediment metagenome TaxID=412755 RepID=A0A0F9LZJ2_9ZZZZ
MPNVKVTNIGVWQADGIAVTYKIETEDPEYQISLTEHALPASADFARLNALQVHKVKTLTQSDPV